MVQEVNASPCNVAPIIDALSCGDKAIRRGETTACQVPRRRRRPARAARPPVYLDQLPRWAPAAGGLKACFVENFARLGLLVRGRAAPGANRQSNESIFHDPDAIFHRRCAHSQKNSTTSVAVARDWPKAI